MKIFFALFAPFALPGCSLLMRAQKKLHDRARFFEAMRAK